MDLDPNKYKYIHQTLVNAIANNPNRPIIEVCNEIAIVNHIPIVAVLIICDKEIIKNEEITKTIKDLTQFYKYDTVIKLE